MSCRDLRPPPGTECRASPFAYSLAARRTIDRGFATEQATLVLDVEGTILFCDEAGAAMFGDRAANLSGRPIGSLIADLPFRAMTTGYNLAYVGFWFSHKPWQRYLGLNIDARPFPLEVSLRPLKLGRQRTFLLSLRRPGDRWWTLARTEWLASRLEDTHEGASALGMMPTRDPQPNYDRLPGLPTLGLFLDRLHQAVAQAARREEGFCLLHIQFDAFRTIEAQHGPTVGEHLLNALAQRLRHCVREEDTLARLGKDEFALILLDVARREDAEKVLNKLYEALRQGVRVHDRRMVVSASIGACIFPQDGEDELSLLTHAEHALYEASAEGGERYRFHSAPEEERQLRLFNEPAAGADPAPSASSGGCHG